MLDDVGVPTVGEPGRASGRIGECSTMRYVLASCAVFVSLALGAAQDEKAVKSGPQVGTVLPAPFDALNVNGKIAAGRQHCLVCQNGLHPAVLVFAREPADGEVALDGLLKKLDEAAAAHQSVGFGAFVVFLSPAARSSVNDASETDIDKLLAETRARNALIAQLKMRSADLQHVVVACYPSEGPKGYNVSADAAVTVVFFSRLKVVENWAFAAGKMTEANVEAILKRVEDTLRGAKKKA